MQDTVPRCERVQDTCPARGYARLPLACNLTMATPELCQLTGHRITGLTIPEASSLWVAAGPTSLHWVSKQKLTAFRTPPAPGRRSTGTVRSCIHGS